MKSIFKDFFDTVEDALYGERVTPPAYVSSLTDNELINEALKRGIIKRASKPEPSPKASGAVVTDNLVAFLSSHNNLPCTKAASLVLERSNFGIKKYGQPLMTGDGRDTIEDARQEAGDLMQYIWKARMLGVDTTMIKELIPVLHLLLGE